MSWKVQDADFVGEQAWALNLATPTKKACTINWDNEINKEWIIVRILQRKKKISLLQIKKPKVKGLHIWSQWTKTLWIMKEKKCILTLKDNNFTVIQELHKKTYAYKQKFNGVRFISPCRPWIKSINNLWQVQTATFLSNKIPSPHFPMHIRFPCPSNQKWTSFSL